MPVRGSETGNVKYNLDAMVFVKVYLFHFFFLESYSLSMDAASPVSPSAILAPTSLACTNDSASRSLAAALDAPFFNFCGS